MNINIFNMRQIYIYILRYRDLTGNRNNTQNKTADRVSWPTTTNKTKQAFFRLFHKSDTKCNNFVTKKTVCYCR